MTKHLVIGDPHAHFQHNNERAIWLGRLIADVRPEVVVNIGDTWDMPSLSGYDKGKSTVGRTYRADINAGIDFNDRLWSTVKKTKRKLPTRVFLEGNHEERIARALNAQPVLEGTVSYNDLQLDRYYDKIIPYIGGTPSSTTINGVTYAHYLVGGISGRPVSGEHIGHSLIGKRLSSCVVGHNHLIDWCVRTENDGSKVMGLSVGCFFDYDSDWAGEMNRLYWRGVCLLNNVEDGGYNLQTIDIKALKKEYGSNR